MKYKCYDCGLVIEENPCPVCGSKTVEPMCEVDHVHCSHAVINGIAYCPKCKQPCCPVCFSHDVVQISRVTGYMSEVSGWNRGKQQELKDRRHYEI